MSSTLTSTQRADRLLRWYPSGWRERYGEEFAELLVADLDERPRSWRRTADIGANGLVARLSLVGLGGSPVGRPQSALAMAGVAIVGFLACGVSLCSQLFVGWRWSAPSTQTITLAMVVLAATVGYLLLLASLAAVPVVAAVVRGVGGHRRLIVPAVLVIGGLAVLLVGGHHFAASWPGATGHEWRFQRLVPGRVAGFGWAETLGISTYWAHPSDLLAQPIGVRAWMFVSPSAFGVTVVGAVKLLRRVELSAGALAYEARLGSAAVVAMLPSIAVAGWWVIASYAGAANVFQAGSLDLLLIASMAAAAAVAYTATQRISVTSMAG